MRRLLYIPIIHEEADMGSAGLSLGKDSSTLAGEHRWALHQETVRAFWESVERYLRGFDPSDIRVYQDGLAADGTLGKRIVEEGAKRGGRNYQVLLALLDSGAHLQATEDAALLFKEHACLRRAEQQQPCPQQREDLLTRRDAYIAERINSTLQEQELGVLFIGAAHNLIPHLAKDIDVREVKDAAKLHRYVQELLLGNQPASLYALAEYVAAPIEEKHA